jgi:nucleotide-binding universal stress UspA family protein
LIARRPGPLHTLAGEIAAATDASVLLATVVDSASVLYGGGIPPEVYDDVTHGRREASRRAQDEAIADLPAGVAAEGVVLDGAIIPGLLGVLEDGVDLVVTGSRAYGPIGRVLAGSVSGALIHEAPCPVVVVPRALAERDSAERTPVAACVAS